MMLLNAFRRAPILLASFLGAPLIALAIYEHPRPMVLGAVVGFIIGAVFQLLSLAVPARMMTPGRKPFFVALLTIQALAVATLILLPPPASDQFVGVFGIEPPMELENMRWASDFDPRSQGYYFHADAGDEAIHELLRVLELLPADPFPTPEGAPRWWSPPAGDGVRTFVAVKTDHSVELIAADGQAWLLARYPR